MQGLCFLMGGPCFKVFCIEVDYDLPENRPGHQALQISWMDIIIHS